MPDCSETEEATARRIIASYRTNAEPASLPAGCSALPGRVAWGFRDFSHSPVTKENRTGSHRTLARIFPTSCKPF